MSKFSIAFIAVLMIIGLKDVLGIADSTQYKILAVDRSRIAVLPNDTSDFWIFPAGLQVVLTNDDFQEIEQVLDSTINSYNAKQNLSYKKMVEKYPNLTVDKEQFIIDLSRYRRQYVAIINQNADKEVWINCFCNTFETNNWQSQNVEVIDGGNCFFHLKINLTKRMIYNFSVNGI